MQFVIKVTLLLFIMLISSQAFSQDIFGFGKNNTQAPPTSGANRSLNPVMSPDEFKATVNELYNANQTALQNQTQKQEQELTKKLRAEAAAAAASSHTLLTPTPLETAPPEQPGAVEAPTDKAPAGAPRNMPSPSGDIYTGFGSGTPEKKDTSNSNSSTGSSWSIKY